MQRPVPYAYPHLSCCGAARSLIPLAIFAARPFHHSIPLRLGRTPLGVPFGKTSIFLSPQSLICSFDLTTYRIELARIFHESGASIFKASEFQKANFSRILRNNVDFFTPVLRLARPSGRSRRSTGASGTFFAELFFNKATRRRPMRSSHPYFSRRRGCHHR